MVILIFLKECLSLTHFRNFGKYSTSFIPLPAKLMGEMLLSVFSPQNDKNNNKKFSEVCAGLCTHKSIHIRMIIYKYVNKVKPWSCPQQLPWFWQGCAVSVTHIISLWLSCSGATAYFPVMMIYGDLQHATKRRKMVLKVRLGGRVQMNGICSSTPHNDLSLIQWRLCCLTQLEYKRK